MRFRTIEELVELAIRHKMALSEVMIAQEMEVTGKSREEIIRRMDEQLTVMERAARRGVRPETRSRSALTGGDGAKLLQYVDQGKHLAGEDVLRAMAFAIGTNEENAAMGLICATPTAGAAGVVPGVLFAHAPRLQATREQMINFLFTAGAFGYCVANNAFISGAQGGCQAEVGSATGMAAAALVEMAGGTPQQSAHAFAIALKNLLGLICDPVAGLVEVPCVKRNAMGAALATVASDMALAGIESRIPPDEVVQAMYEVGKRLPVAFRETALGGLADTPTGRHLAEMVRTKENIETYDRGR
ncbi:MAG: L-serine ammonia-lyase, iron-sulfur-dependent, subunit alpha [Candidatus Carbobacillus altaicus]|nr:L-serine ammonia-lyase, iron-sulfur-dependent, subunit alpha [Candidatus Carbobacillus altaicus]